MEKKINFNRSFVTPEDKIQMLKLVVGKQKEKSLHLSLSVSVVLSVFESKWLCVLGSYVQESIPVL